jgi:hypothetical protein
MLAAIFINNKIYADENFPETGPKDSMLFTESCIITGFGGGNIDEGNYQPVLLIWHMGIDMNGFLHAPKDYNGKFSLYLEPQISPVVNPETDIECGIGMGFKFMYPVTDSLSTYILASAGPHYISANTKKQASGFIFSDTIGIGFYYFLTKKSAVNMGYRFRHMSNIGMSHPNHGINNHFGTIGYSIFF